MLAYSCEKCVQDRRVVLIIQHFLLALDILTCDSRDDWEASEIPLILEEIKRPPDPASVIRAVFESRIVSSLKQNMPLPAVPDLNDDQVYEELTQGFQDLQQCFSLGRSGAVTWEVSGITRLTTPLAKRSACASKFDLVTDALVPHTVFA